MSSMRRLILGCGVILVGLCAAWPFRHAPAPPSRATARREELEFGKDLPLQVPGQKSISRLRSGPLKPAPEPKTEAPQHDTPKDQPAFDLVGVPNHQLDRPPVLPDKYRPLFQPRRAPHLPTATPATTSDHHGRQMPPRRHTIHDGDTLESLALRYLGSAARAPEIFAANRDVLADPNVLPIGVEIIIPRSGAQHQPSGKVTGIHGGTVGRVHMEPLAPLPNSQPPDTHSAVY